MTEDTARAAPDRVLSIPPERLPAWLTGFEQRHGDSEVDATPDTVTLRAADGAVAQCAVPFPPLVTDATDRYRGLPDHAARDRQVGVLLVRRGGYAAGVFAGTRLLDSKVGSRHVQGRTAAGGQSQQRFARRREKQAREAFEAAADTAVRVLIPHLPDLDGVITGGDRAAIEHVLADRRLAALHDLIVPPHLPVPDPKLAVLKRTPQQFRAVTVRLSEPAGPASADR